MPCDIVAIAQAVACELKDCSAEVAFSPEFDLQDLTTKRCVVVPGESTPKKIARGKNIVEYTHRIEIGLLVRSKKLNLESLISQSQKIGLQLLHFRHENAVCFQVDFEPLYNQEQLRERNQFTSIIVLLFKEFGNVRNSRQSHDDQSG